MNIIRSLSVEKTDRDGFPLARGWFGSHYSSTSAPLLLGAYLRHNRKYAIFCYDLISSGKLVHPIRQPQGEQLPGSESTTVSRQSN